MTIKNFLNIRKIENIEKRFSIKIVFQQFLLIASFIVFVSLLTVSYTGANASIGIDGLDNNVPLRVMRAMFPVFMTWYIFASIWAIKSGCDLIENSKIWQGVLLILSFIPIIALVNLILFAMKINKEVISYYKDLLFTQDPQLKEYYKWGTWRRYLLLGMLIVILPVAVFVFLPDAEAARPHNENIWFYSFNYFTIQTNLMILFFTTTSFFFPGLKVFKNNNLQIVVTIYIFIVGAAWNGLLLPDNIRSGKAAALGIAKWVITCWYHILNPIVFITGSMILIFKQPFKKSTSFANIFKLGGVYPLMYLTFVAIVPFTAGVSIYGKFTNVNPSLNLGTVDNPIWGSYANFAIVIGFWFIFMFFIWLVWFIDKKVNTNKIETKQITIENKMLKNN